MYTERPHRGDVWNVMIWGGAITLILMVFVVLAWGLGWFAAPFQTMSPQRVQQLSRQANDAWQGLEAQQATIAVQRERLSEFNSLYGDNTSEWPQGKREEYQQLSSALRNLVAAYNLQCGQYNALWQDEWRSLPAPDDLPTRCDLMD